MINKLKEKLVRNVLFVANILH